MVQAPENVVLSNNYFRSNVGSNLGGAVSFAGGAAKGSLSSNFTSVGNTYTANEVCSAFDQARIDSNGMSQSSKYAACAINHLRL